MFDFVYFKIKYTDESGSSVNTLTISCDNPNAMLTINGETMQGPFSITLEVHELGILLQISTANYMADTFTLNLSLAE